MSFALKATIFIISISTWCLGQEPVSVVSSSWERTVIRAKPADVAPTGPARAMIAENKNFERGRREVQAPGAIDPNELTVDGRSAALEKAVQESRTPKSDNINGYTYKTAIRNDSGKTVEIVFWEYRFTEIARPENVVHRQFLCAMKLKKGGIKELAAFSQLGPSDVIDAASLANRSGGKLFTETVIVNRIEFSDGSILQRPEWKFGDLKKDIERATSTPWGSEACRKL